jgi:RNA recognition motif-containing protein
MAESGYAQPYQAGAADSGAAGASESEENNNLIVNYIPSSLSEVDLRNLFSPYGTIMHCKLIIDRMTGTGSSL